MTSKASGNMGGSGGASAKDAPLLSGGLRSTVCAESAVIGEPLVTIITVVHNGVEALTRTLDSVIARRRGNMEHVIVDGGSTDGTVDLLTRHGDDIDYWVSQPDSGIYDAMNKGIALSRGRYLLFLNAGDELVADLDELSPALSGEHVVVYGRANMVGEDGTLVYVKGKPLKSPNKLLTGTPLCHQAIFYLRDTIGKYDSSFRILGDRVLTHDLAVRFGLDRFLFVQTVICNYYEGGFSRQNPQAWLKEEVAFLRSRGWRLYAGYRRVGWWWKNLRKGWS